MRKGFTLVEIMVTIALVGAMFAVFGTALIGNAIRSQAAFETQATALAEGALAAALSLPSSSLTDRSGAPAIGLVEKRGQAAVAQLPGTPSSPNALAVVATSTAVYGMTFSSPLPDGPYEDFTASVAVMAPADAGSDWRAGLVFRATDLGDCYRLTVGTDSVTLDKLVDGTPTALYTAPLGVDPGSWTILSIAAVGQDLSISKDGVTLTTATDPAFAYGEIAMVSEGGELGAFDDLTVSGATSDSWNFDADPPGDLPSGLETSGATDLPGGTLGVTIGHPTAADLAEIDVTVGWQSTRGQRSVTVTGYAH